MKRSPQQAKDYLDYMTSEYHIPDPHLRATCKVVIENNTFQTCWGGEKHHHMYDGGLLVHTAEVLENCRNWHSATGYDSNILLTAAVCHDFMKIKDYVREGDKMVSAPYKKLIHHVQGSAIWVAQELDGLVKPEMIDQICHCILSHHGRREWGSPVEPQTKEACILHFADMMSMAYGEGR